MHATVRPYATAGVALVGAGLIAATPTAASLSGVPVGHDVTLAATQSLPDLLAPWQDVFNTASDNASTLANNYLLAPGVAFQQFLANQADFWSQIFNDPSNATIADVSMQIQDNLTAVLSSYSLIGADDATVNSVLQHTLNFENIFSGVFGHMTIFGQVAGYLPPDVSIEQIQPILNFLASPMSGLIMGALGPSVSPWIALSNSINDGDGFGETLANIVGAYFNGATLNLDSLVPMINDSGQLGAGNTLYHLDFAFGGLLTPGVVAAGPYDVIGDNGDAVSIPAVGGSIFNSIGMVMNSVGGGQLVNLPSQPVGPIGAWLGFQQTVADLLGWNGTAAPGIGIDFPNFTDDFFGDGGSGGVAAETVGWLQDLLTGLFG